MGRARSNGEGSIRRRPDGRWEGRLTLGMVDGKQRRVSVYGKTKAEVVAQMDRLRTERLAGALPLGEEVTLGEWLERFVKLRQADPELQQNTKEKDRQLLSHIKAALGDIPLRKLEPHHLEGFYFDLIQRRSASTVRQCHNLIAMSLDWALRNRKQTGVTHNPARLARKPGMRREPVSQALPPEFREPLLAELKRKRLFALFYLYLALGLRRGEGLGLRKEDLTFVMDPDTGKEYLEVRIRRQVVVEDGKPTVKERLKTKAGRRTLYLPAAGAEIMAWWLGQLEEERKRLGYPDQGWLFPNRKGKPTSPVTINEIWDRVRKEVFGKLEDSDPRKQRLLKFRIHDLRHSWFTQAARIFRTPKDLAVAGGHSDPRVSIEIYQKVHDEDLREGMLRMAIEPPTPSPEKEP